MNTKKVNVQMLKPQSTNGISTIDTTSSQTIAKPIVGCYTSMNELIQWCILNAFNVESQDGTKYVAIDYEEMQSQLDYFVKKEKEQLVDTFDNGQANSDTKCQDYKDGNEYFNSSFKI